MPREVPHRWLIAETVAWPIVSGPAFDLCTLALERSAPGSPADATRKLADDLDEWLRPRASGCSLQMLAELRDRFWFQGSDGQVPLVDHIQRVAAEYLAFDGAAIRLRSDGPAPAYSYAERLSRWHWLGRSLPADLLVAALGSHDRVEPMDEVVSLGSREVQRILDLEVAETHLHVGAAVRFPVLWTGLMQGVHALDPGDRKLQGRDGLPFGPAARFVAMLHVAAIARIWLGLFLFWRHDTGRQDHFAAFLHGEAARCIARRCLWPPGEQALLYRVASALGCLRGSAQREPSLLARLAELRLVSRYLCRLAWSAQDREQRHPHSVDFLAWLWPSGPGRALPETRFCYRALGYLHDQRGDTGFAQIFWQYQRVRGQVFRYVVQEPGTQGLDWFSRHYRRISVLRRPVDGAIYRHALETESRGLRLASFEARTSPEDTWDRTWREVQQFARQAAAWQRRPGQKLATEMGLVLHFVKERRCQACGRLHADPRHAVHGGRYGSWFDSARIRTNGIAQMLRYAPESLLLLRGMDVANLELAIPTWVTLPFLRHLRRVSGEAARVLIRRYPGTASRPVEPLRMTYHAGEDFRSLHEGLRRIHELLDFGVLERGDRIGHGLALGTDVEEWARARPYVVLPAEERLDDLLWERERYAGGHVRPPSGREITIRDEILRLGQRIHGDHPGVEHLTEARRLRHVPEALAALGYPRCRREAPPRERPVQLLLWRYLTDAGVFERGQEPVELPASPAEIEALTALQAWLRDEAARHALTIESNPTSNLVIAEMVEVSRHPSFVFQPLERVGTLPLSINTDNPLTFSTCLADEYNYLHAALLQAGIASRDALDWLERARQAGWDSRFTLTWSADPHALDAVAGALQPRRS